MERWRQLVQFLKDVRAETRRVQWPSARQTLVTSGVVLVFTIVTAIYLAGVDFVVSKLMEALLR